MLRSFSSWLFSSWLVSCTASDRPVVAAPMGVPRPLQEMEQRLEEPGPIVLERVVSANWQVPRSGVINLDNPAAAGLVDGPEPIQIYTYVIRHPERGVFLVDTGVAADLVKNPGNYLSWPVRKAAGSDTIRPRPPPTHCWRARAPWPACS